FPWVRTYLPSAKVMVALSDSKNLPRVADIALKQVPFAHPALKSVWPDSIKKEVRAFLRLPPTLAYDKSRETVIANLGTPLPKTSFVHFTDKADLFSATIDASVGPSFNELAGLAPMIVDLARGAVGARFRAIQTEIAQDRMSAEPISPVQGWMDIVSGLQKWNDALMSDESTMLHAISEALAPVIAEEAKFWE